MPTWILNGRAVQIRFSDYTIQSVFESCKPQIKDTDGKYELNHSPNTLPERQSRKSRKSLLLANVIKVNRHGRYTHPQQRDLQGVVLQHRPAVVRTVEG